MSKYKAGQIITIRGKIYRIVRFHSKYIMSLCIYCAFKQLEPNDNPCNQCLLSIPNGKGKMEHYLLPPGCYFKEIKPKS